jgi:putative hydrolase of the HAD superfamily
MPMLRLADVAHISTWIFDLDNTLYPARINLFSQIDERMGAFIADLLGVDAVEAKRIQKRYFHDHGTTLNGLMRTENIDPNDFLAFVHDIDFGVLEADARLDAALQRLPGRKLIYTNADAPYAARVLEALGVAHHFEAIHDIVASDYAPKPEAFGYHRLLESYGVNASSAAFVEDMARNLKVPKALGMATVWVNNGSEWGAAEHETGLIDHEVDCVSTWLDALTRDVARVDRTVD